MSESILAWHFSDGELRFDYAGKKVEAGLVLEVEVLDMFNGFAASSSALDALESYTVYRFRSLTEFIISRLRLSGDMIRGRSARSGQEVFIAQKCEHLWVADARDVLEKFLELQKNRLEEIRKPELDLRFAIYRWIYSDNRYLDPRLDVKELASIHLHPLGNQVLEIARHVFPLEKSLHRLLIWDKARTEGFDLDMYLKQNTENYAVFDGLGDNKSLPYMERHIYERGRAWAITHPPQEFAKFFNAPKDPNELFQEMLMQLAPEEYGE